MTRLIAVNKAARAARKELDLIIAELLARGDFVYEGPEKDVVVKGGKITIVPRDLGSLTVDE